MSVSRRQLLEYLELDDVDIDVDTLEEFDATTAFIAGYAIGMAEGTGQSDFTRAQSAALKFIRRVIESEH